MITVNGVTYEAIPFTPVGETEEDRFCIVNKETGEIADDAQGWGYTSPEKAYIAFKFRHNPRARAYQQKKKQAKKWLDQHPDFRDKLVDDIFHFKKSHVAYTAENLEALLREFNLESPYSAKDILEAL